MLKMICLCRHRQLVCSGSMTLDTNVEGHILAISELGGVNN